MEDGKPRYRHCRSVVKDSRDIFLPVDTLYERRHLKPVEELYGAAIGCGYQVAAYHNYNEQDVKEFMDYQGGERFPLRHRDFFRLPIYGYPYQAKEQQGESDNAKALVKMRPEVIEGMDVREASHVDAEGEEGDEQYGHRPVERDRYQPVAILSVCYRYRTHKSNLPSKTVQALSLNFNIRHELFLSYHMRLFMENNLLLK